ncbi:DUF4247 domain-containing protein [Micromonospora sagamiensis]|uniref:Uncharacterized protein DUF4247 n=1 Tax=Micromonospora sagamiensis TaxID=47875 RepID=A0A562WNM0_9ACTN|nr:DUF4247 domain-containing protein [Micromonospora sagamiensis]TWJ31943.1 uncharacterized protein DUF4247 [Micromonospora sagamiensis]BCL15003.1 hypothetical protein GCM10017556_27420 [Micromonospora sagamiensis]
MTYRRWFVVGAVFAVIGVLVAAFAIFYGNFSPRGYVEDRYSRAVSQDIGKDALAYTSTKRPSEVADEVTDAWKPADQYVDGSGVYLRYDDDSVVILPVAAGSLILLERVSTAYPRYRQTVGNSWGWGRGSTVRGGGPGSGK